MRTTVTGRAGTGRDGTGSGQDFQNGTGLCLRKPKTKLNGPSLPVVGTAGSLATTFDICGLDGYGWDKVGDRFWVGGCGWEVATSCYLVALKRHGGECVFH